MKGIYLGQLPPAEVARLKAELAETIIANFCYPRFYDYRTNSLRMRPVDRAKRQEVWLYLSSVDFTTWNRVDLMSSDFQRSIERLFIQFVQRNRSFFGEQGRKRMSDVRMLITSTSTTVAQGLRGHISGQRQDRQGMPPFGSPRQAISWATAVKGYTEPTWEQIATTTMLIQQQLQEIRGEAKTAATPNEGVATPVPANPPRKTSRPVVRGEQEPAQHNGSKVQKQAAALPTPVQSTKSTAPLNPTAAPKAASQRSTMPLSPAASVGVPVPTPVLKQEVVAPTVSEREGLSPPTHVPSKDLVESISRTATKTQTPTVTSPVSPIPVTPPVSASENASNVLPTVSTAATLPPTSSRVSKRESSDGVLMRVSDDDIAIFEQLRDQLIIWLRVEAIQAGLEIAHQTPPQLLEMLHQQERYDSTRLQVVSTLLNLANQVIKNGRVSVLDYKQALTFHLMHTKR